MPKTSTTSDAPTTNAPVTPDAPTTALATTQPSALAAPAHADPDIAALAERLPSKHAMNLLKLSRPSPEAIATALAGLPDAEREQMNDMIDRLQGGSDFRPTLVKVYHGTGNDPVRPEKLPPGNFYSAGSVDLDSKLTVAVLRVWDARVLWPPKDSDTKQPVCSSHDSVTGTVFGECKTCPNAKKKYADGGCTPQIVAWFIDKSMTGIYELSFSKTSMQSGRALKTIVGTDRRPWYRWMNITAVPRVDGDRRWYVTQCAPVQDAKVPANTVTSDALRAVLQQLATSLDIDVYYRRLEAQYTGGQGRSDSAGDLPAAGAGKELAADTSDADFGGANTGL